MYEANPMAMIIEQAGGKAYAGTDRLLDLKPKALHQRTSVILGSPNEVDQVLTSQVLRLANAAFYGVQGQVSEVPAALVMLGTVVTRSIVLSTSVCDMRRVALRGSWSNWRPWS